MRALLLSLVLLTAGCVSVAPGAEQAVSPAEAGGPGGAAEPGPAAPSVVTRPVGHPGAEPTMGVTSDGTLFFIAFEKALRSMDHGETWEVVHAMPDALAPALVDPMLWVDPHTDRVFVNHLYRGCTYLAFSDDLGASWTHNPAVCGVLPLTDHQKVATAPPREGALLQPATDYPNLVLFAYSPVGLTGSRMSISLDGGLTFPVNRETVPGDHPHLCNGGLHGHPAAAPNGTIHVPKRSCDGVLMATSHDGGWTWTQQLVGADVGSSECRKNPEVATDVAGNAYVVWSAADHEIHLSASTDDGRSWRASVPVSPPHVEVATMPVAAAGDPGRLAVAYYGIEASETVDAVPDRVNDTGRWHLYLTMTENALAEEPTFVTVQVTPDGDPVQVGPISTNSGCDSPPGSRNLLDFIDMVADRDGRVYVAYADGCTEGCTGNPDATMEDSRRSDGYVARVDHGMSLFEDAGLLERPTGAPRGQTS